FNGHREDAFTPRDRSRQPETGGDIAGVIDSRGTFPDLLAVNTGADGHLRSHRKTTFGPFGMQVGGNHIARTIAVAHATDLALDTRSTVCTNVELALRPGIGSGMVDTHRIFASGLPCRDVPGKSGNAIDNRGGT